MERLPNRDWQIERNNMFYHSHPQVVYSHNFACLWLWRNPESRIWWYLQYEFQASGSHWLQAILHFNHIFITSFHNRGTFILFFLILSLSKYLWTWLSSNTWGQKLKLFNNEIQLSCIRQVLLGFWPLKPLGNVCPNPLLCFSKKKTKKERKEKKKNKTVLKLVKTMFE